MKYVRVLFLPLIVGGCVNTSTQQEVSIPPASVEGSQQAACVAQALRLERYPLVDLRSDLGEVLIKEDDKDERQLVIDSMKAAEKVIRLRAQDKDNIGRGDHAKPLGCYEAEFTVSASDVVRFEDQAGIARRENLGKTFRALVRLSNSEPKDVSDYRSTTVGLAIKVKLGPAKYPKDEFLLDGRDEQDFIAGGLDTFVSSSIREYADLFKLRIHPFSNALAIKNRHPEAFEVFGTEPLLRYFRTTSSAAPMVLEKPFSSLLPYVWGNAAVKYRFDPCHLFDRGGKTVSRFDSDYQTKLITEFLKSQDICYVMKVQTRPRARSDEERKLIETTFPIEDAKVRWPEAGSPENLLSAAFHEVARIKIKSGTNAMGDRACERLAFNPWKALKAHQPLGSLNRARLAVYKQSECTRKKIYETME